MTDDSNRNGDEQQKEQGETERPASVGLRRPSRETPFTARYDFSDLKDAHPTDVAFQYVEKGWFLVPVRQTGEIAMRAGVVGATKDLSKILKWVETGIATGIATGRRSGVVALRCRAPLGQRALKVLLGSQEPFATLEAREKGEAKIFLFRAPAEELPSREQVAPGLDFLGEGGYFLPLQSSWSPQSTELALLPDCLSSLITGTATFGLTDLVASGDFAALEGATVYEAAQAYKALGCRLAPLNDQGEFLDGKAHPPSWWKEKLTVGLGLCTGAGSGIVGLWFGNPRLVDVFQARYGPLPLPQICGENTVHCFRAPSEPLPSRKLEDGIEFVGENDYFPAPPSTIRGAKLKWKVERTSCRACQNFRCGSMTLFRANRTLSQWLSPCRR